MFQLDASLKPLVLDKLSRSSTVYFLLDRYWDQLVLYLLLAPLQWLHLTHLLYTTRWESYGFFGKVLVIFYVACCFTFWEGLRIFVYYTCRAVGNGDDLGKVGSRLIASASHIGKSARPLLEKMLDKAATSLKSSSIGTMIQSAGKAVTSAATNAATLTISQNGAKSGSKSEHESQEQSQNSSAASNRTGTETSSGSESATSGESAFATKSSGGSSAKE